MKLVAIVFLFLFAMVCIAQSPSPMQSASPAILQHVNSASNALDQHAAGIAIGLGVFLEIAMRVWPTKSPLSWFALAAVILSALSALFLKIAGILNNVVEEKSPKA